MKPTRAPVTALRLLLIFRLFIIGFQVTLLTVKSRSKIYPRTGHEGQNGEWRYNSTLSLTLTQDGGGLSTPRPGRLTPGKETRYLLCKGLRGPQGRSGRVRKTPPRPGFDPWTVQPVTSNYTDRAISAYYIIYTALNIRVHINEKLENL